MTSFPTKKVAIPSFSEGTPSSPGPSKNLPILANFVKRRKSQIDQITTVVIIIITMTFLMIIITVIILAIVIVHGGSQEPIVRNQAAFP